MIIIGIMFHALKVVVKLGIPLFMGYILYIMIRYQNTKTILIKSLAFLISIALIVGLPLGFIRLAYPKEVQEYEQKVETPLAKGEK